MGKVFWRREAAVAGPARDVAAEVQLAFRMVLHREVDAVALARYGPMLAEGRDLAWLLEVLAGSEEYGRIGVIPEPPPPPPPFPLDSAPSMAVSLQCGEAELQALWEAVARLWSALGETEPHWSVLTEERYRAGQMDAAAQAVFQAAGEGEVNRLLAWVGRNGLRLPAEGVCVELGCGVGRITRGLARRFARVVGVDVSGPHLAAAARQMAADGLDNVVLTQVRGREDLAVLAGADLFYSVISLQHSPPPIILAVLEAAFAGLRPGGLAFFQVPTYGLDYSYPAAQRAGEMEMHCVPQRAVFALAAAAGLRVVEVQPDWCVGKAGQWISNTFLLEKDGAAA